LTYTEGRFPVGTVPGFSACRMPVDKVYKKKCYCTVSAIHSCCHTKLEPYRARKIRFELKLVGQNSLIVLLLTSLHTIQFVPDIKILQKYMEIIYISQVIHTNFTKNNKTGRYHYRGREDNLTVSNVMCHKTSFLG
jgi:hypothetical protein